MTDLLGKLCSAIATQEGFFAVTGDQPNRPQRNNSPGDLRAAPWVRDAKIVDGYWHAESITEGIAGLYHQVALDIARGYTLRLLIYAWAPAADRNDPASYLAHVMRMTGITDADVALSTMLELVKL